VVRGPLGGGRVVWAGGAYGTGGPGLTARRGELRLLCGVWKKFRAALELDGRDWCGKVSWAPEMAGPACAWWHELCWCSFLPLLGTHRVVVEVLWQLLASQNSFVAGLQQHTHLIVLSDCDSIGCLDTVASD